VGITHGVSGNAGSTNFEAPNHKQILKKTANSKQIFFIGDFPVQDSGFSYVSNFDIRISNFYFEVSGLSRKR